MKTIARMGLCTVALAFAGACSTAHMTTYTPVDEKTKYSEDVLLSAAKDAAEELGFRVVAGEGSSTFDTREKEVATSSIPRLSYKYTFHVDTTHGELLIQATCIQNSTTNESEFKDCGDDRPERVVMLQAQLHKKTLEHAKTEQARAPDFSGFGESDSDADKSEGGKDAAKSGSDKGSASDAKDDDTSADDSKAKAKPSAKKK
ncbi:MAG TPA: hypothetical protein VHC69_31355 [Polyangiaceae bacterium]|nr:hypothetical protein [Polyangiaceae bacterium]